MIGLFDARDARKFVKSFFTLPLLGVLLVGAIIGALIARMRSDDA